MIGPILIALSWLLLRFESKGLSVLGFNKPKARLYQFAIGFFITGFVVVLQQMGQSITGGFDWELNHGFGAAAFFEHLRWNINSVLFEELLFRGYILYQMIRWLGDRRAVMLNAVAFGVYHWFSYGIFGNVVMMAFVFLLTGAFGYMFALAFAKTKSVVAPIALHLSWNLISYIIFSKGPLGPALLVSSNGASENGGSGIMDLILDAGLPIAMAGCVSWYLVNRFRSEE